MGSWAIYLDIVAGTVYQTQEEPTAVYSFPGTVEFNGSTLVIIGGGYVGDDYPALLDSGRYAAQLSNETLTIAVPLSDGTVQSYQCSAAPIDEYNGDVSEMDAGF